MKQKLFLLFFVLYLPLGVWADLNVGGTFIADGVTYKVTSVEPREVQVGDNSRAISRDTQGAFVIPSSVRGRDGNDYSVTSIGNKAFSDCSGLTSITIPNSVTSIGQSAFQGCSSLTSITIPNSVTSIGQSAFQRCSNLNTIVIESGNTKYDSRDNCNAIIETSSNTLIFGCKGTIIPNTVTSIEKWAFLGCTGLTSITIPNSVTSIGWDAFGGCTGLTSITIPNSMTSIGRSPFDGCTSLTSITIPNSVTSIEWEAFLGCTGLTSITIPNSVISIGQSAFRGCSSLISITIPNSVTSIGYGPFTECSSLTSIIVESGNSVYDSRDNCNAIINSSTNELIAGCHNTIIPNSVTSIGSFAFWECAGLTSITIPNSVTSIGNYAFEDCTGLTSITIPNSVTSIGTNAFDGTGWYNNLSDGIIYLDNCLIGCKGSRPTGDFSIMAGTRVIAGSAFSSAKNLTSVTIPNSVISIGQSAFSSCSSLTSITIPNSVTSIGRDAFRDCTGLTSITIPNSVTSIGRDAFGGCTGLTSITIPNSVTSIESFAFADCSSLTSITIPNSVTSIGEKAFRDCTGLTSITIPNSVTSIGARAFGDCSSLTSVTVENSTPVSIGSDTFTNRANATLYVPFGSKAAYEAAAYWNEFKEIVELDPEVTTDEALSADALETMAGKTGTVGINLTNTSTDLTAYQFDLTLPAGITLAVNDKGKYQVTKTDRYEDDSQSLSVSLLEGNTYRIVCFSLTNGKIQGTSGAILNAVLSVGNDVAIGTYEAQMTNCIITKASGAQLKLVDATFDIVVNNVTPGDANGDNEVNVSDIVEVVNYILGNPSAGFVPAAADLNNDGEVNVTDIVMMVNIIMSGGNARTKGQASTAAYNNDRLTLEGTSDRELSLCLENNGRYVASQFDLCLSEGLSVESIALNENRSSGHELAYSEIGHNRYRVIVYSLDNSPYRGSCGELVNIRLTGGAGDIGIEEILFVTEGKSEKQFAPLHRNTTGIHVPGSEAGSEGSLYNLKGQRVIQPREGIYIKDGKKVVIK